MREQFITVLRALVEFLDSHPEVPVPVSETLNVFPRDKEELTRIARSASWQKDYLGDSWFVLRKEFGPITFDVAMSRSDVCRKVVTGTRIEPARPATPEREVETFEWVCDEPLLKGAA